MDRASNNRPLMFLKVFNKEEYRDSFLNGNLYSNNFGYFVEEEKNSKGRGDQFEGVLTISNATVQFKNHETGDVISEICIDDYGAKSKKIDTEKVHLFSVTGVFPEWFEIVEEMGDGVFKCKIVPPDAYKREMESNFGNYITFFSSLDFIENLDQYGKNNDLKISHGRVKYLDFATNPSERVKAYVENKSNFFFQKDIFFDKQDEYRFVFENLVTDKPEVLELGQKIESVSDFKYIDDLLEKDVTFTIDFNDPYRLF